ncbi:LOW QUALITY PROTEIN: UPF0496 protein At3g19330 [Arabidopsis lyrata subsp. lyrata]|uniref:LOW QUALITY PROTEIN: UPF0496 protein At3g19330 n=1 Tax=Arabidopsis lyrata subsp. lyrata TaxID=81972 RepID=UPI000A29BB5E|nr:LOW QUALITY PROTEIN: UPF0496 protein At3g19330 [Arabidopsis lyrata subsp. lyrata]|eukprot:XP_020888074.1 LOW QUALITY PROTEIN: UPF0496 protein At3g19330 [Arabidopsis lyrata subsp. lyrata]
MRNCLSFNPASPEVSLGDDPLPHPSIESGEASTSRNDASIQSPTFNLSRELAHAFQTPSYHDVRSRVHVVVDPTQHHHQYIQPDIELLISQVLQPNKECVQEAIRHFKQTTLTHLVSTYFQHSENATRLCLNLYQNVHSARHHLYTPLLDLFNSFPGDTHAAIDESLCNLAFDVFLKLDTFENPFSSPESHSFQDTQLCFSQLKNNLDRRLRKSRSRVRLIHHATAGSALCLDAAVVAVAASAAVIASHALPILVVVAGPLCSPYLPHSFKRKELTNICQLNAASKGTFVLNKDLDTIDRLVSRLHSGIEYDKHLIRLGLERGRDLHSIQEIVKQLRKNNLNLTHQLKDLEDHICLWFTNVNKARSLLLKEIHLPRTENKLKYPELYARGQRDGGEIYIEVELPVAGNRDSS